MFDYDRIFRNPDSLRRRFESARPFRHLLFEDFLPTEAAEAIWATFPKPEKMKMKENDESLKLYLRDLHKLNPTVKQVFEEFARARFLQALSQVTGIAELHGDPYLQGAGLHQGCQGSFLNIHADFNFHEELQMHRRLNLLIYFNKDWREEYQGYFEIWDKDLSFCKMVKPGFNRCVLIETTETSFHGYLKLDLPEGVTRKSLAAYFYTLTRPAEEIAPPHSTLWQKRPEKHEVEVIN